MDCINVLPRWEMMHWSGCMSLRDKAELTFSIWPTHSEWPFNCKPSGVKCGQLSVLLRGMEECKKSITVSSPLWTTPASTPLSTCWVSDIQSLQPHYRLRGCCCDMTGQEEVPGGSGVGRGRSESCWRCGLWPCLTPHLPSSLTRT